MIAAILLNKYVYLVISYYKINSFRKLYKVFICNLWHGLGHFGFQGIIYKKVKPVTYAYFLLLPRDSAFNQEFFLAKQRTGFTTNMTD